MNHGNMFTRLTCGGEQENNMKGLKIGLQAMHKKSQKCYNSRSCGDGTLGAISMKFGGHVHMMNVKNSIKFDHRNSIGLILARV
jgi:urease beta subunit